MESEKEETIKTLVKKLPDFLKVLAEYDPCKNRKEYSMDYLRKLRETLSELDSLTIQSYRILDNEIYIKAMNWESFYD